MKKYDKLSIGIILGLILPAICIIVYYFIKYHEYTFSSYIYYMKRNAPAFTPLIAVSLLLNIAVFTLLINTNRYRIGKGLFWGTVIYGLTIFVFKLLA